METCEVSFDVMNFSLAVDSHALRGPNFAELAFAYDPDGYWVEIIQRNGFRLTRGAV